MKTVGLECDFVFSCFSVGIWMLQIFQYATKLSYYISKEGQTDQTFAKTGSENYIHSKIKRFL